MHPGLKKCSGLLLLLLLLAFGHQRVQAQDDAFIGEVRVFAGNFAPLGWLKCDGSLLQISEYQALYSILGTTYGGDGVTTFGLPNLVGRAPLGTQQGSALTLRSLGEVGGTEKVTLTAAQIPSHTHGVLAYGIVKDDEGNSKLPAANYAASSGKNTYRTDSNGQGASISVTTTSTGGLLPTPIENRQPYLVLNYIICVEGIYPTQD